MSEKLRDKKVNKLGFGFMRLPKKDGAFDTEQINRMVDLYLQNGGNYFDTAFVYEGSEEALRDALVKRHPRESYMIASKLNMFSVQEPKQMAERFETTCERLGTDYLDCYLLHGLNGKSNARAEELGAWEFVKDLKATGRIRHLGFSFHGPVKELDEILTNHPEAEFVQLQINYLDWDSKKVDSRGLYETARRHDVPVIIMEPVKGGMLSVDESVIAPILKAANPNASLASWAMRFAASLDGVFTVLSGMSALAHVEDNVETMKNLTPLTEAELETVKKAVEAINAVPGIPCTSCEYCVKGCPQKIAIPTLMNNYSNYLIYSTTSNVEHEYRLWTRNGGKASDCVQCRACEEICPQNIEITDVLGNLAKLFD